MRDAGIGRVVRARVCAVVRPSGGKGVTNHAIRFHGGSESIPDLGSSMGDRRLFLVTGGALCWRRLAHRRAGKLVTAIAFDVVLGDVHPVTWAVTRRVPGEWDIHAATRRRAGLVGLLAGATPREPDEHRGDEQVRE